MAFRNRVFFDAGALSQRRVFADLKQASAPTGSETLWWEKIRESANVPAESVRLLLTKKTGPALLPCFSRKRPFVHAILAIPEEFWATASVPVREGVIRHELAHWRRGDLLKSALMRLTLLLHWFNPMAHFALKRTTEAMESVCDAEAFGGDVTGAKRFVESMLTLYETSPEYALFQNSFGQSDLTRRVTRLRQSAQTQKESLMKKGLILTTVLLALTLALTINTTGKTNATPQTNGAPNTPTTAQVSAQSTAESAASASESKPTILVRGTVLDESKKPIPGAALYFENYQDPTMKPEATADEAGNFVYETNGLPSFPWIWAVSPDDRFVGIGRVRIIEGKRELPPTEIIVKPARIVTGRVVDTDGNPVAGATVAGCYQITIPIYRTTAADGSFTFPYPGSAL